MDSKCGSESFTSLDPKGVRMIEFFSGIGGMRYGVEQALRFENAVLVGCKAYEISLYANKTYACNFQDAIVTSSKSKSEPFSVQTKLVEQLKAKDLDGAADLWTMSPPCQPFTTTRNAKQKDSDDERCKGFKAIIELLRTIEDKPRWIMVENVKGFVGSHMLSLWHECLHDCGYTYEEYLLSPTQLKIPNHRTRYYMICERSNRFQCRTRHKEDLNVSPLPGCIPDSEFADKKVRPISFYLNTNEIGTKEFEDLKIPDCVFEKKWAKQLPVVSPLDRATHCFTAAYGRQIHRATGSLLLMDSSRATSIADTPLDRTDMTQYKSKLRRFSPRELLRIFCFPDDLKFPDDISLEHQYKLIGNSVNVSVISHVASFLLKDFTTLKAMN